MGECCSDGRANEPFGDFTTSVLIESFETSVPDNFKPFDLLVVVVSLLMSKTSIHIIIFALFLNGCAKNSKFNKPFKHNTPLIKKDIKSVGKAEVLKTLETKEDPFAVQKEMIKKMVNEAVRK